jgi:DNA-nicking Smr family endonuclease
MAISLKNGSGHQKMTRLDLHGHTVHDAWKIYRQATQSAYLDRKKSITVITGHGKMSSEFSRWVEADPYAVSCARMDPNTGAWQVKLRKNKNQASSVEPATDLTKLVKKWSKDNVTDRNRME